MKRALILIIILSALTFGCGWWLDGLQQRTAADYLDRLSHIRQLVTAGETEAAISEQTALYIRWKNDAHWLNFLLDHHHTRDVEAALRHLATVLQEDAHLQSLLAIDELTDALEEVAQRDTAVLENIL